jgi:carboxyl-terminal processing protease
MPRGQRARDAWRPKAAKATSRAEIVAALEGAIAHLHDDHVSLSERVPLAAAHSGRDGFWAEWIDGAARDRGARLQRRGRRGPSPGPRGDAREWRGRSSASWTSAAQPGAKGPPRSDWALASPRRPRDGLLKVAVRGADEARTLTIEHRAAAPANGPPILARRMGEDRNLGYIRIRNALWRRCLPAAFRRRAGTSLKDTKGLMLDLRETTADGKREITDAIVAHFVGGNADYRANVIVLVDRWTAGEGEALAAALHGRARASLVGTPMAGLRGRLGETRLPNSGIVVRFPVEKALPRQRDTARGAAPWRGGRPRGAFGRTRGLRSSTRRSRLLSESFSCTRRSKRSTLTTTRSCVPSPDDLALVLRLHVEVDRPTFDAKHLRRCPHAHADRGRRGVRDVEVVPRLWWILR